MQTKHLLLVAALFLVAVSGVDLALQASSLTWSRSIGTLFALALLSGVFGYHYLSGGWRRVLFVVALGFFIAALIVGEWSSDRSFPMSLPF